MPILSDNTLHDAMLTNIGDPVDVPDYGAGKVESLSSDGEFATVRLGPQVVVLAQRRELKQLNTKEQH